MNKIISLLVCIIALCSTSMAANQGTPAKAVFWDPSPVKSAISSDRFPEYVTKSIYNDDLSARFNDIAENKEIVAFLRLSDAKVSSLASTTIKNSIKNAGDATVMPYVYAVDGKLASHHILATDVMKKAKPVSLEEFHLIISENKQNILSNNKPDAFIVSITENEKSQQLLDHISTMGKSMFFTTTEDSVRALPPKQAGQYNRILTSLQNDQGPQGSIYYKPEGAEYSIYYANTYLYLTPDIFVGIMTGLFMFFVVLIGLFCLGGIQGPATFASKLVPNGREA